MATQNKKWDVIGIENPLIDLLCKVDDHFLKHHGLVKNQMRIIDQYEREMLLEALRGRPIQREPGGSCANTMLGISYLGGKTVFCGKVGGDAFGKLFAESVKVGGVQPHMLVSDTATGSTIILISPDAARTMNTYLGASHELSPEDVPLDMIGESKHLYLTAYLWDVNNSRDAAMVALNGARECGVKVVLNLADPNCVGRHQKALLELLKNGHVDIVIANQQEVGALLDKGYIEDAMRQLSQFCKYVVITLGAHGAYLSKADEKVYIEAPNVKAIDTTGAGDAFAAGFLFGETHSGTLEQCGQLGAAVAADIVQRIGPRFAFDERPSHDIVDLMRVFQ